MKYFDEKLRSAIFCDNYQLAGNLFTVIIYLTSMQLTLVPSGNSVKSGTSSYRFSIRS